MTRIEIDDRGAPTLEIDDAAGEAHSYRASPAPAEGSAWACTVERLDAGERYLVTFSRWGTWRCTCPAHAYRKRGAGPCKHQVACKGLLALLRDWGLATEGAHGCHGGRGGAGRLGERDPGRHPSTGDAR